MGRPERRRRAKPMHPKSKVSTGRGNQLKMSDNMPVFRYGHLTYDSFGGYVYKGTHKKTRVCVWGALFATESISVGRIARRNPAATEECQHAIGRRRGGQQWDGWTARLNTSIFFSRLLTYPYRYFGKKGPENPVKLQLIFVYLSGSAASPVVLGFFRKKSALCLK